MPTVTLAIDFGAKYIGLALVRNQDGKNVPLVAGTLAYDRFTLSKKTEPWVQMRRMRRTKKSKKARLRRLEAGLLTLGLDRGTIGSAGGGGEFLFDFINRGWPVSICGSSPQFSRVW